MKKLLKRIAIVIGVLFALFIALGIYIDATSTPEEKAARQAKIEADKAAKEAQKAQEQAEKEAKEKAEADAKAKAEVEKAAKEQATKEELETTTPVNLGITPKQLGADIDRLIKETVKADTNLKSVEVDGNIYMFDMGDGAKWYGEIDKTGNAVTSTYTIKYNGDEKGETTALLFFVAATARSLSPELPKEKTAGEVVVVMNDAMNEFLETSKASTKTKIVGNVKYIVEVIPEGRMMKISFVHKDH